jgi:signal transduction histidine kinase
MRIRNRGAVGYPADREPRSGWVGALGIAAAGVTLTIIAAAVMGLPTSDAIQLAAIASGAALLVGGLGALVLRAAGRFTIAFQTMLVALTAIAAVAAGALSAARAMFLSVHDLSALIVVLVAAGTAGVLLAYWLGARVGRAGRELGSAARSIGEGVWPAIGQPAGAREFAALAHELEEMSAKLEQTRSREQALENSRRELVAWVSHDLRTPLAGIRAIAEALADGVVADAGDVDRYYATLRREADRLAGLVDDLFELSAINAGALKLQIERASLGDVLSDALAAAAPVAQAKGVRLKGRMARETPEVDLSIPEIARVFRNLLENAIRHTPSDKTVQVEAGVREGQVEVSVADGCGGIPPEDLDRVFEPAFRGETARTPGAHGGAGLGLAIARGIVEAHQGQIRVDNEQDGCRFTVRLPLPAA